ncbi:sel1 repeat family protein [Vibrio metschnikovii]|nr:sel1 repeat family protein [Vibrio metschnikovii]EKO3601168.1 sel1 repeat family protein [Vibrio metschnikovii]EKO3612178.1 sel1 repeat family protein [Vibrio metschnikovii]EKO3632877.1 sel1 repeat family protein [Vibrio metschnikovii]EKO3678130.1 sel1 repeat family protein [Vibrio metschnikovii]
MKIKHFLIGAVIGFASMSSYANADDYLQLRQQAEQGYSDAQFVLGLMYYDGEWIPQNYQQAMFWYRKAAEQGHSDAQFNLGFMYYDGEWIPQNYQQAMFWYRKAAEQGHSNAQFNLGFMYGLGKGVPQNYQQAYAWFFVAFINGNSKAASGIKIAAKQLTYQELAEASRLANLYIEQYRSK